MSTLIIAHTALTLFNTGLIWTIQLVHYPLFNSVGSEGFVQYEQQHTQRISFLVVPTMIFELITGSILIYSFGLFSAYGLLFCLLLGIWLSTFLLQVPMHNHLSQSYSKIHVDKLVRTNWIRTILWSSRSALLIYLVHEKF